MYALSLLNLMCRFLSGDVPFVIQCPCMHDFVTCSTMRAVAGKNAHPEVQQYEHIVSCNAAHNYYVLRPFTR